MSGAEILILGKLFLTFGVLLGVPVLDLWLMQRHRERTAGERPQSDRRRRD